MKAVQVREAKAKLSAPVESASRGEPIMITRHGEPVAALVSVEDAARLHPEPWMNLVQYLQTIPGDELDLVRDETPPREIDL